MLMRLTLSLQSYILISKSNIIFFIFLRKNNIVETHQCYLKNKYALTRLIAWYRLCIMNYELCIMNYAL